MALNYNIRTLLHVSIVDEVYDLKLKSDIDWQEAGTVFCRVATQLKERRHCVLRIAALQGGRRAIRTHAAIHRVPYLVLSVYFQQSISSNERRPVTVHD